MLWRYYFAVWRWGHECEKPRLRCTMTAIENKRAVASSSRAAHATTACERLVLLIIVAGFAVTVLVFYAGYSTAGARYGYADAVARDFGYRQSPVQGLPVQ